MNRNFPQTFLTVNKHPCMQPENICNLLHTPLHTLLKWAHATEELGGSIKINGEGYNLIHYSFATSGVETGPRWNQYSGVVR